MIELINLTKKFANLTAVKITNTRLLEAERANELMEQEMATAALIHSR